MKKRWWTIMQKSAYRMMCCNDLWHLVTASARQWSDGPARIIINSPVRFLNFQSLQNHSVGSRRLQLIWMPWDHWNKQRPLTLDSAAQFKPVPPTPYSTDKKSQFWIKKLKMSWIQGIKRQCIRAYCLFLGLQSIHCTSTGTRNVCD